MGANRADSGAPSFGPWAALAPGPSPQVGQLHGGRSRGHGTGAGVRDGVLGATADPAQQVRQRRLARARAHDACRHGSESHRAQRPMRALHRRVVACAWMARDSGQPQSWSAQLQLGTVWQLATRPELYARRANGPSTAAAATNGPKDPRTEGKAVWWWRRPHEQTGRGRAPVPRDQCGQRWRQRRRRAGQAQARQRLERGAPAASGRAVKARWHTDDITCAGQRLAGGGRCGTTSPRTSWALRGSASPTGVAPRRRGPKQCAVRSPTWTASAPLANADSWAWPGRPANGACGRACARP